MRGLASAFGAATRNGDVEALRELYADDAVVWHNYDEKDVPASTTEAALRGLHDAVTDLDWEDVAVQTTESGFVLSLIHISEPTRPY